MQHTVGKGLKRPFRRCFELGFMIDLVKLQSMNTDFSLVFIFKIRIKKSVDFNIMQCDKLNDCEESRI